MTYAKKTKVTVDRSRAEIERLLHKHGADQFINGWDGDKAMIGFRMKARYIRFTLTLLPPKGMNSPSAIEQNTRSRWRALALVIKAKLEAVETGIVSFDEEFLAHIVMPDSRTVGAHLVKSITEAYATGKMQPLLPEYAP
jgi:hypothetical protein